MPKENLKIGITIGCPVGIGPEITLKALAQKWPSHIKLVVLGDASWLKTLSQKINLPFPENIIFKEEEIKNIKTHTVLNLSHLPQNSSLKWGQPTLETAKAMALYIKKGAQLCLEGRLDALVTAPISKKALHMAGEPFPGHTEMLAQLTKAQDIAMAFWGTKLKIVLVTIHLPFKDVPKALSIKKILKVTRLAYKFLKEDLGIKQPRLALAALNPHASEGGLFGKEEEQILIPAVNLAQKESLPLQGPFPSDSLFFRAVQGEFDLIVSLYHDQGLIPFKLLHFEDGVNLTLGLPIVRTSVDHGTAYDIAGQGSANPKSMIKAIELAIKMAENRKKLSKLGAGGGT